VTPCKRRESGERERVEREGEPYKLRESGERERESEERG
jgi:hypothetical protein